EVHSCDVEFYHDRAVIRGLGSIPADAGEIRHLLARWKGCAHGLTVTNDLGDRCTVTACQCARQKDVVQLTQMPLCRAPCVIKRPAIQQWPTLNYIFAEVAGRQDVDRRDLLRHRRESISLMHVTRNEYPFAVIVEVATDRP